ncbi:MAG: hypothetical protein Q7T11_04765 [Deltaproteobacteria bacterium]|nr:hypothetical protein [Deltaproteobacteria bacterium]
MATNGIDPIIFPTFLQLQPDVRMSRAEASSLYAALSDMEVTDGKPGFSGKETKRAKDHSYLITHPTQDCSAGQQLPCEEDLPFLLYAGQDGKGLVFSDYPFTFLNTDA